MKENDLVQSLDSYMGNDGCYMKQLFAGIPKVECAVCADVPNLFTLDWEGNKRFRKSGKIADENIFQQVYSLVDTMIAGYNSCLLQNIGHSQKEDVVGNEIEESYFAGNSCGADKSGRISSFLSK